MSVYNLAMMRISLKILLVLLLVVGGCVTTPERSPELQQQIELANNAIEISDYDRAVKIIAGLKDFTADPNDIQKELNLTLLRHSASNGSTYSMKVLGRAYYHGREIQQDYETAFALFETAANAGDAEAIYLLGSLYHHGEGTEKDLVKARALYAEAAHHDIAKAQRDYASFLASGKGGPRDFVGAAEWYKRAADNGDVESKFFAKFMAPMSRLWDDPPHERDDFIDTTAWVKAFEQVSGILIADFRSGFDPISDWDGIVFTDDELEEIERRAKTYAREIKSLAQKEKTPR